MCRFIETIKIVDGSVCSLDLHNARMNGTRSDVFGINEAVDLGSFINCPRELTGVVKCRVLYSRDVLDITYERYAKRTIKSLKLVESNDMEYSKKYEDRNGLKALYDMRGDCDEILIVKNGLITDTSFSNVVFYDGMNWITPFTPLLAGIKRLKLLLEKKITEAKLTEADLKKFTKVSLINAMLELGDIEISAGNIEFREADKFYFRNY